jgi:hypothetical protein
MKNDLYGKDIRLIQRDICIKTKLLLEKIKKVDHRSLNEFVIADLEEIQKDHSIVENFLITTLWLDEESKGQ